MIIISMYSVYYDIVSYDQTYKIQLFEFKINNEKFNCVTNGDTIKG